MNYSLRLAYPDDIPALNALIERSARGLSLAHYSPREIESAIRYIFGVDTQLVEDGTYLAVMVEDKIVGCGGWSRRRTLYGGDQRRMTTAGAAGFLDPALDAAKIRAFFVAPEHARRGIGRLLLDACTDAASRAGFQRLELMATLPGVPLYTSYGFHEVKRMMDVLPDGTQIAFVHMERAIDIAPK